MRKRWVVWYVSETGNDIASSLHATRWGARMRMRGLEKVEPEVNFLARLSGRTPMLGFYEIRELDA